MKLEKENKYLLNKFNLMDKNIKMKLKKETLRKSQIEMKMNPNS